MTHFGRLISVTRARTGLTRQQLAERIGYTNLNRGARRVEAVESGRGGGAGLVKKVIDALAISEGAAAEAIRLDEEERRRRYLDTIGTPVDPVLTVRLIPAVYLNYPLPDGVRDPITLESFACEVARTMGKSVHLVLPSRTSLWINPFGEVYSRSAPDNEARPVTPMSRFGGKPLPGFLTRPLLEENAPDERPRRRDGTA